MNKKAPIYRKCCVTKQILPREQLFRVVSVNSSICLDINFSIKGRGAYICKNLDAIKEGFKKNSLSRALKCKADESIYIELIKELSKEGTKHGKE